MEKCGPPPGFSVSTLRLRRDGERDSFAWSRGRGTWLISKAHQQQVIDLLDGLLAAHTKVTNIWNLAVLAFKLWFPRMRTTHCRQPKTAVRTDVLSPLGTHDASIRGLVDERRRYRKLTQGREIGVVPEVCVAGSGVGSCVP